MPHQSDAFEELDVCDDVRESSYYRYRDIKNEFSNFQGTKQAETGTAQFRVSKSRLPRIKSYPNLTQTEPTPTLYRAKGTSSKKRKSTTFDEKRASVFGWIVSSFSPHKTKRT